MRLAGRTAPLCSPMLERCINALNVDDAGCEDVAATRERLRGAFPPGAVRRMTQLGMLVGSALAPLSPTESDSIVYASRYGESRSLEAYLDSFPLMSPTLFQASIHPSGVQQSLIGRQLPCAQLYPMSGDSQLVAQALLTAALTGSARTLLCGGDERGSWLRERGLAAEESFAFAMAIGPERTPGSVGQLRLEQGANEGELGFREWFSLLTRREAFDGAVGLGWRLRLEWYR